MYDAILVSPHYSYSDDGTAISFQHAENHQDLSMIIPLGTLYVAQYLSDCGYNVRLVHIPHELYFLRQFGLTEEHQENLIKNILAKYPAHVCGIQVHWYLYSGSAVYISKIYKQLFPDSKVYLGGFMATACWKDFLAVSKHIDGVVLGEGEKPFKEIVDKILNAKNDGLDDINGLAFRDGNHGFVHHPGGEDSLLEVAQIPIIRPDDPAFESLFWQRRQFINISRGLCPEKCAYCVGNNKGLNPRNYQTQQIDRILEQLNVYQECGFTEIFLGENHFLNISFMKELIENIIRENLGFYFELETHPVIFENAALLDRMIEAKFLRYTMGCESGSGSLLKRIGRKSNARQILDSVKRIADSGGIVLTSWISNLPGETETEFLQTQTIMQSVVQAKGFIYWIENLHVLPGSKLHEKPEDYDIDILLRDMQDWFRWSILSKRYVNFEEVRNEPLSYLTHLNRNVSPADMIERFYSNRRLARRFIPEMRLNLENRIKGLPSDVIETELKALDWYEDKGWRLWLF